MRSGNKQQNEELAARLINLQRTIEQLTLRCSDQEKRIYGLHLSFELRISGLEEQLRVATARAQQREQRQLTIIQRAVKAHRDELDELDRLLPGN